MSSTGARPPSVDRGCVAVKTGAQIGFLKGLDDSRLLRDHKALNLQSRWKAFRQVGTGQEGRPRGIFRAHDVKMTGGLWVDGSSSSSSCFVFVELDIAV